MVSRIKNTKHKWVRSAIGSAVALQAKGCRFDSDRIHQMSKSPLFVITKKDLEVQFFRAGGKGGQKQNKTSSACRIIHHDSGAVGESRDERSQVQNKKIAFNRLTNSPKFKAWLKLKASAIMQGYRDIEHKVDKLMSEDNIKVDFYDPDKK